MSVCLYTRVLLSLEGCSYPPTSVSYRDLDVGFKTHYTPSETLPSNVTTKINTCHTRAFFKMSLCIISYQVVCVWPLRLWRCCRVLWCERSALPLIKMMYKGNFGNLHYLWPVRMENGALVHDACLINHHNCFWSKVKESRNEVGWVIRRKEKNMQYTYWRDIGLAERRRGKQRERER